MTTQNLQPSTLMVFAYVANSLRNYILSNPNSVTGYQPYGNPGPITAQSAAVLPKAFKFHYEGEQSVNCVADITDHYVENNTAIQDQIALKPIEITTQGFMGELNDVPPDILQPAQALSQKLTNIVAYAPQITISAEVAYNNALQVYQAATNAAKAVIEAFTGLSVQTEQQKAFKFFFEAWQTKTFFFVQTPWAIFPNMAIKSLRPIQSAETRVITDFEITFKQINTAQAVLIDIPRTDVSQNQAATQSAPTTNLGVTQPTAYTDQSISLSQAFSGLF